MSKMKLYGASSKGGSSFRPLWVFAEAGVTDFEFVPVDMNTNERREEPYLSINPNGQVPSLIVDDTFILLESQAINSYIASKFKPELLGTTDEERARVWQWNLWSILNPQRYFLDLAMELSWAKTNDEKVIAKANEQLARFLKIFDNHLNGKSFVVGEKFTAADINVATTMSYASYSSFDLSPYVNISRWLTEMTSRPAYKEVKA